MSAGVVSAHANDLAATRFLTSASHGPAALLIEGEPGIGKTTLWTSVAQQAREQGFRVMSARPAAAESVLAYASLADLLRDVATPDFSALPDPQRHAIDGVLLRADVAAEPTGHRAVAAGFHSIVEGLSQQSPVLVAIDDLQWLDPSSARVIAFTARRLSGPVGVLAASRTEYGREGGTSWLQLSDADAVERIRLQPLTVGALHAVVSERLGRSFSRPTMVRIHEISGGNPFYAVELARATAAGTTHVDASLPTTLSELVRTRVGRLDRAVHDVLLAAACASAPTVELLARAVGVEAETVTALLEDAESKGIVAVEGNRVRFTHPLLARGVYADATPARRRALHRCLADAVDEPEPAARHLALATTTADPVTLQSLDEAAGMARMRGAPAAAAELVELAIGLGGDTPQRQIRSASHHFEAGDPGRARIILDRAIDLVRSGPLLATALFLLALVHLADDSFLESAGLLERGLVEIGDDLALRVHMLVTLAFVRINVGQFTDAMESVDEAVDKAQQLGQPALLSHALAMRVTVDMFCGNGLDDDRLQKALELEDPKAAVPLFFRASTQHALVSAWVGDLDRAHEQMTDVRRRCIERGEENELAFLAFHSALIEIWRGNFAGATEIAVDTMERARHLGGDQPLFVALTIRAALAACAGDVEAARADTEEALAAGRRSNANTRLDWPISTIGFLEVARGDYAAALEVLQPLLSRTDARPDCTEIMLADFVPDAVEAMIQLGRLADAEPLIERLERNGGRLDRPWMLAVGGRCRAMLLSARNDLAAAEATARLAMTAHDRLPMPLERARTQFLLGQIQRRQRRKTAAAETLRESLAAFEGMGLSLWAQRVRAELDRCVAVPRKAGTLTPAERRVAELAASGMTNRDVAATLFVSPKTVEVNLSRVYRKLGIHTRAELGRQMGEIPDN